jgi:hypothetical protein
MKCPKCNQSHGVASDDSPHLCFECLRKGYFIDIEEARLIACVDEFAAKMKEKLIQKAEAGWSGWDCDNTAGKLEEALILHAAKLLQGQPQAIDVANLAMFLWNLKGR